MLVSDFRGSAVPEVLIISARIYQAETEHEIFSTNNP